MATEHTVLQVPHAFTLFVVAVSHPFATLASQLPKPAAQVIEQAPELHEGEPLAELYTSLQEPQLVVLV